MLRNMLTDHPHCDIERRCLQSQRFALKCCFQLALNHFSFSLCYLFLVLIDFIDLEQLKRELALPTHPKQAE